MTPNKINVVSIQYECRFSPTTLVGKTSEGHTVYVRYRWGHLSVRIDPRDPPPLDGAAGEWAFETKLGGEYDGCLDYADLKETTKDFIEWPEVEPN